MKFELEKKQTTKKTLALMSHPVQLYWIIHNIHQLNNTILFIHLAVTKAKQIDLEEKIS